LVVHRLFHSCVNLEVRFDIDLYLIITTSTRE